MKTLTFTQVQWRTYDSMSLKTVWAVLFPYSVLSLYLCSTTWYGHCVVACDQGLGLPRFVNEVKVNGKVFAQREA